MTPRQELFRLALPLAVMHVGYMMMGIVDTAIIGHWNSATLAGVGISASVLNAMFMIASGTVMGLDTLIAQAVGAGDGNRARAFLADGRRLAGLLSLPTMLLVASIPLIMGAFDVAGEVREVAWPYILARLIGIWPALRFAADRSYLQALGQTRPLVLAMLWGNVLNAALDFALVFGVPAVGLPALGALGAGLATSISSYAMYAVTLAAVRANDRREPPRPGVGGIRLIVQLGWPLGLQISAEFGLFAMSSLLAGRLGKTPGAAHMVAISVAGCSYAVMLGVGGAAAVLVGRAIGAGDPKLARHMGRLAFLAGAGFVVVTGLLFLLCPRQLSSLFTGFDEVLDAATPLVMIAAAFQLSDSLQAIAAGALRGLGENRFAFLANLCGHYLVGLPVGAFLAFRCDLGAPGLWWGLTAGLSAVAIALIARFEGQVLKTRRYL